MSMKDYTRFSNRRTEVRVKEDPTSEVETVEIVEQTAIEVEPEVVAPKQGVVTDCVRLNVRKEPSREADVVCEITANTNLVIYEDESTEDFYKVCTFSGIEGYCMKRYVSLLP